MGQRLELQAKLSAIPGVVKVYFQPPDKTLMEYPCIIYDRSDNQDVYAGNKRYRSMRLYSVTVISRDPDTPILTEIEKIQYCSWGRHYVADKLHHYNYNIYF